MNSVKTIRIIAWTAVAVLAAAIIAVVVTQRRSETQTITTATIGGPVELINQRGETVTDASLKGHPAAIFFGYTSCPDVCPTTLFEMTAWLKELGPDADRLKVYFVTVDPERDSRRYIGG